MAESSKSLMTLAAEIRAVIFTSVFDSTTVSHGFDKKDSQNTSLLRTSHQIHDEAKPLVTSNISLHFRSTAVMIDTLTNMTPSQISQIRKVRVKAFPFPLYTNDDFACYYTYHFADALPLFPGLQLDLLEVEDSFHPGDGWGHCGTYYDIEGLLESDGWKEFHFITPTTEFMTSDFDQYRHRVEQPVNWNKELQKRDGVDSGAEVKMYVANERGVEGATDDPESRTSFEAIPGHLLEKERKPKVYGVSPDVDSREVLIVAKRGKGADFVMKADAINRDIKSLFDRKSWQEIKEDGNYVDGENDPTAHL